MQKDFTSLVVNHTIGLERFDNAWFNLSCLCKDHIYNYPMIKIWMLNKF